MESGELIRLAPSSMNVAWMCKEASSPAATRLFDTMRSLHNRDYHGGYLCVADPKTGLPYIVVGFGEVSLERADKCLQLCLEKARRLASHPEHICSAQSRNDAVGQWPGAIRTETAIYSFSGLDWESDETFDLILAMCTGRLDHNGATEIAMASGNTKFEKGRALLG